VSDLPTRPPARFAAESGLQVEVRDETRAYAYADLFHVRLRVIARLPGQAEPYTRELGRLGVRAEDLEAVRAELLDNFRRHALPYLLHPEFPGRWAAHRARAHTRTRVIPFPSAP